MTLHSDAVNHKREARLIERDNYFRGAGNDTCVDLWVQWAVSGNCFLPFSSLKMVTVNNLEVASSVVLCDTVATPLGCGCESHRAPSLFRLIVIENYWKCHVCEVMINSQHCQWKRRGRKVLNVMDNWHSVICGCIKLTYYNFPHDL